jgi:hypothetical protein
VSSIDFKTYLPNFGDEKVVLHNDGNTNCFAISDDEQECVSVLTQPKLAAGTQSGNDAGIWLPMPYTEDNLPWTYAYLITLNRDGNQPDSIPTQTVDPVLQDPVFGEIEHPQRCDQDTIREAIIPEGFFGDPEDYVFDCVLFEDDFVSGGTHRTRVEEVTFYFGDTKIYGVEFKVGNGVESIRN